MIHNPMRGTLRAVLLAALAAGCSLASGCGEGHAPGGLRYVEPGQHEIQDPGGPNSAATGIGCGESERDALSVARQTAHYNLRTMLGAGNYKVRFTILRPVPGEGRVCVEVEARTYR